MTLLFALFKVSCIVFERVCYLRSLRIMIRCTYENDTIHQWDGCCMMVGRGFEGGFCGCVDVGIDGNGSSTGALQRLHFIKFPFDYR